MGHTSSKHKASGRSSKTSARTKSPVLKASDIIVQQFDFGISDNLTRIKEKSITLKYCTPHFRAIAIVEIPPLPVGANIQVGWIQVCTELTFISKYGDEGLSSWELPELVSGKYEMVSDADGQEYPWYGITDQVTTHKGPTKKVTLTTVQMDDHFTARTPWEIPGTGYSDEPNLTFVYRKQRFFTFLALKDVNTDTYQIIRTLTWSMELAIDVNPKKPLGERTKLLGPFEQERPCILPKHLLPTLECYALKSPCANFCQVLLWRPKHGDPEFIRKPLETTMDMDEYLVNTKDLSEILMDITKNNYQLGSPIKHQQKQQTQENNSKNECSKAR